MYTEHKVTDSKETAAGQPYFSVDLNKFGYSLNQIKESGYKTIVVIMQMNIRELDDEYQEIYLYKNSSAGSDTLITPIKSFEHGSGYKNTSYTRYEFYAEVPVDNFSSSFFYIRFGANGKYNDDWMLSKLAVQICLSKENQKIGYLAHVSNAVVDPID